MDVFKFLESIKPRRESELKNRFIYCDPPYCLNLGNVKENKGWELKDLDNLIITLKNMGVLFAISEYDTPEVLELAEKHGLQANVVKKSNFSQLAKTIKTEMLYTNYNVNSLKQMDLYE